MPSDWQDVQRRFYDATADEYDENFQQANPYFAFVLDRFLAAVDPRPGERILELGASGGRFTLPLLDRGCRVTAVDISPPFVHNVFPATRKLEGWLGHWRPLARTFTLNVFVARKA